MLGGGALGDGALVDAELAVEDAAGKDLFLFVRKRLLDAVSGAKGTGGHECAAFFAGDLGEAVGIEWLTASSSPSPDDVGVVLVIE